MKINFTCGQIVNDILKSKSNEIFIPFNEAMIHGNPTYPLFDETFIQERVKTHHTTLKSYQDVMQEFLEYEYSSDHEIILWFGNEEFCQINVLVLLAYLNQIGVDQEITIHLIDEYKIEILKTYLVHPNHYQNIYKKVFLCHNIDNTSYEEMNDAIQEYLKNTF